jgi:glutamate N-acetyltransferase / amino-acid N-acetyltransferase
MTLALPSSYRFAAVGCHVRPEWDRDDLALIVSDRPAVAAGVFTQNRVAAAPVRVSQTRIPAGDVRGIVVNAGNANACTGDQGLRDAEAMTARAAACVGGSTNQWLVASTGVIGRALPLDRVLPGITAAAERLSSSEDAFHAVTRAILTTDTKPKVAYKTIGGSRILGFAKGAAMIGPNLATMLGFILTDAAIRTELLQPMLAEVADRTFNCVSVEGHTSTNDSVFLLANGVGAPLAGEALSHFASALDDICGDLAEQIAADAEGANHLVVIQVDGMVSSSDARRVAKCVAESALVKTAIYGGDPNWGRFVSAAGYAGVPFHERDLSLWLGPHLLYDRGTPTPLDPLTPAAYLKANRRIEMRLVFTLGSASCTFRTCDLTPEYVRLNGDYTT